MLSLSEPLKQLFLQKLSSEAIPANQRPYFERWLRYYLDFCRKYGFPCSDGVGLPGFLEKLRSKGLGDFQRRQAKRSVEMYLDVVDSRKRSRQIESREWDEVRDKLKSALMTLHYSPKTITAYVGWVRRFKEFLGDRAVGSVTAKDAAEFFTYLAKEKRVAAATQNQAFNALLFLYRRVWKREYEGFEGVVRAKTSNYIPVVLSRREIDALFAALTHPHDLLFKTMYGCGLRISEGVSLRVGDLDFEEGVVVVRNGKGMKDRMVPMPKVLTEPLEAQVRRVNGQLMRDIDMGFSGVFMPGSLSKKFKRQAKELRWQWLFPAKNLTYVSKDEETRRYHCYESKVSGILKRAGADAGITKRISPHTLRHTFASHLLQNGIDIRTIQEMMGHTDVRTTMKYTHTVKVRPQSDLVSPLDLKF